MIQEIKKKAAQAIVNIFETGTPYGDYSRVTLLAGDTGHLTYGRSQTTLASGNLYLLIRAYCRNENSEFGEELSGYLERLENRDFSLDNNTNFKRLLRDAGHDPVMKETQDEFFDRVYWNPAVRSAINSGIRSELGTSVVYDSFVHGSWLRIKKRTDEKFGSATDIGEHNWIAKYIAERYDWLKNHSNQLLRKTVYRMKSFGQIMATGNWSLELPFVVRGVMIDKAMLMYTPSPRALSSEDESPRLLKLRAPYLKGHDVSALQEALAQKGIEVDTDGIFGPETKTAVIEFQKQAGLEPDGIVGPATRAELELFS